MVIRRTEGVRYIHLPTGLTALSRDCAPRGQKWTWYHQAARKLLLARLCRPEAMMERPPIRRVYDLAPPLGIEPNIRQDGRWLVVRYPRLKHVGLPVVSAGFRAQCHQRRQ